LFANNIVSKGAGRLDHLIVEMSREVESKVSRISTDELECLDVILI